MGSFRLSENMTNLWQSAQKSSKMHQPVMIIDGTNMFIRSFSAVRDLNLDGVHVGGIWGFLRTLAKLTDRFQPCRIVVVFDGEGGSGPRRMLDPDYKGNRDRTRIMNSIVFDNKEDETAAHQDQLIRLISYLRCIPVAQVCMDYVEADDVLAWVSKLVKERNPDKPQILVSGDRDYFQLIDETCNVFYLHDDRLMDTDALLDKYGVTPHNWLMYRCLIGDISDNVPGIAGFGKKTSIQRFPLLGDREICLSLDEVIQHATEQSQHKKANALYGKLVNAQHRLILNHKLMKLGEHPFTEDEISVMNAQLTHERRLDVEGLIQLVYEDQLPITDPAAWVTNHFMLPHLK